ncbi:rho GTPase-activating protein conundrum isoform X2 [Drosophila guanche]|uniref:rho GTPase-activating protein conundrum isoform X2 n=1 Tax=Drosophila guanche TaxID=7266 RepID=UPI001470D40C|nr:rho GTPase-activating protein conundrum isoform X2 [Drosophila guanche]
MNSNTSMDNTSDQDYSEFLNEYLLQANSPINEPEVNYEDGEMEAEWLVSAGYPELTKPFEQGLELRTTELEHILATLSKPHADVIKQRVRALNQTVRGRTKNRSKRKPDIRDVFRDFDSSTGTRSRSATPDSLDSIQGEEVWSNTSIPSFASVLENNSGIDIVQPYVAKHLRQKLRRTPSAPLKSSTSMDIFRGSHVRCDIPMHSADGVELLGYSRIGTMHLPRNRSGSDPSCSVGRSRGQLLRDSQSEHTSSGDSSDECPMNRNTSSSKIMDLVQAKSLSVQNLPLSREGLSFESICRDTSSIVGEEALDIYDVDLNCCSDIDSISETDLKRLQPIFWLELATIFDRNQVSLDKRKPFKRRRKEEGSLFGVSLNALIRRDQQVTGQDSTLVPLFLESLLAELIRRGSREEGILRIAGHKNKTEILYNELESSFYQKPGKFSQLLGTATVHELSALLKRWLRELPQPLLTNELIQLFYQCHKLPSMDQKRALSIVCQLLPHENRNTLRSLLRFLNCITELKDTNKMNLHNVSTIIAPSFFPPRFIHPIDKNSIEEQVKMAAQCSRLTNVLILHAEKLFQVANNLIMESKSKKARLGKKGMSRRLKPAVSLLHRRSPNALLMDNHIKDNSGDNKVESSVLGEKSRTTNQLHRFVV